MFDWLDQLLTPAPLHLRELGHVREVWGIRQRWRDWHEHWAPHCQRTKDIIRQAIALAPSQRRAVVFGSGWLHDVPLEDLAAAFREVVLVDLLHPFSIRWWARRWSNVVLLESDISDVSFGSWQAIEKPGTPLPVSRPSLFLDDSELDLTISCNLLSQLPCMPAWYLRKHRHPEAEITPFCRQIVQAHIDYLERLPGVVTVIADTETITVTPAGAEVARRSTLYGASFPWDGQRWQWRIVPYRPKPPHHGEVLNVVGVANIKARPLLLP